MSGRVPAAVAAVAVVAIIALYLVIINSQGGASSDTPLVVPFVAGYLALMGLLLTASLFTPPGARPALRAGASAGLVVLGVLAAFSIGVAVLIAAGLAIAAAVLALRARPGMRSVVSAAAAAVLAVAVLVAGFQIAWTHIVCPTTGGSGGSTASLIGHSFSYECNDGVLTIHR